MKYQEALDYIESIRSYGIVPGLDSIKELCMRMGNPQDRLKFVHISGTNGKGSTLAYISTILKCAGYRVGRFSSPHISEYREIIQVNGKNITKKALCEGIEIISNICNEIIEDGLPHPTPFEVETALGFWYFDIMNCDIVVLETGMGGLYDATNIIGSTLAAVITDIGMDHMKYLGKNIADIAAHKAGILKADCDVISSQQKPEAMEVIRKSAESMNCHLRVADKAHVKNINRGRGNNIGRQWFDYCDGDGFELKKLEINMGGCFQPYNALLAVETIRALRQKGFDVSENALRKGLRDTVWRGRFTIVSRKPLFVADGAHNEDAAEKLAQSVEIYFTNKRIIYIMGMLRDKEYEKVIGLTHFYADQIITVTPPDNSRAMSAYELAQEIAKVHEGVTAVDSLEEAVEMARLLAAPDDVILAFGSLSYLGRLMKIAEG